MATSTAVSVIIGGAVGASFGKAVTNTNKSIADLRKKTESEMTRLSQAVNLRRTDLSRFGELRTKALDLGKAVREARQRTTELGKSLTTGLHSKTEFNRLSTELKRSQKETVNMERAWQQSASRTNTLRLSLSKTRTEHQKNQEAIKRHREGITRLAAVEEGRKRMGQGYIQAASGMTILTTAKNTLPKPVMLSANYQTIIRDIAIKGRIARTDKEDALSESIRRDAAESGMADNELAQAVNILVDGGMDVAEAKEQARNIARFSVSQNADSTDTAKLVLSLRQAGATGPAAVEKMLGKIAVAGDLGSFEAKDMAKYFPSLMPQFTAFGIDGEQAGIMLANSLQTQMKAAGNTDEAANNFANLLAKITSADTVKKFDDNGIDLGKSMQAKLVKGNDPITAFLDIVQEAAKQTDPARAEEMAALQQQIARTQDPAAAQKMLDGYLEMAGLSEYIVDAQEKQTVLAAIQNQKLHEENLKIIQTTDGVAKVDKNLADWRASSAQMWKEVGNALDRVSGLFGDAIRPITDSVAMLTKGILDLGAAILKTDIGKISAFVGTIAVAGYGLYNTGSGIVNMARGAWQVFRNRNVLSGGLPGTGGAVPGKGGLLGRIAGALGVGGIPVFVTNWPGGPGALLDNSLPGKGKKPGFLSRAGTVAGALASKARMTMALARVMPLSAWGATGGTLGTAGAAVLGAGAAGYAAGSMIVNPVINGVVSTISGRENTLGTWLYEVLHPEENPLPAENKAPAPPAQNTFSPQIQVTVNGDVKDPRLFAAELMPHVMRSMEDYRAKMQRSALFDGTM